MADISTPRKLIYLFNPVSGTTKKDALLKKIEAATRARNIEFEFVRSNPKGDYETLKKKIQREHITDVIIIGGDGTVNQATSALRECNVRFGIIPRGSGNGLAYAAGISRNTSRALETIFQGRSQKVDAFLINENYACMLCGLGFDASVAQAFATKTKRGLATYTQQSLLHFFKAGSYRFEIILGDTSFSADAYFISIANANQFGNYITIAPQARLNDGLLDIVIVQKMSKAFLPLAVLQQVQGGNKVLRFDKNIARKTVFYFQTATLTINNLDHAPLHIDGEPRETAGQFEIKILRNCFELIQPASVKRSSKA